MSAQLLLLTRSSLLGIKSQVQISARKELHCSYGRPQRVVSHCRYLKNSKISDAVCDSTTNKQTGEWTRCSRLAQSNHLSHHNLKNTNHLEPLSTAVKNQSLDSSHTASNRQDFYNQSTLAALTSVDDGYFYCPDGIISSSIGNSRGHILAEDSFRVLARHVALKSPLTSHYGWASRPGFYPPRHFEARFLHTSTSYFKEESIAEKTRQQLIDSKKTEEASKQAAEASPPIVEPPSAKTDVLKAEPSAVTPAAPEAEVVPSKELDVEPLKKSIRQRIIDEVKHYYHGFRLLGVDVRVAVRHLYKILNGKSLTRRERHQLVRTTSDLFRLVPFLVFIVVPFMEFLLPVALKLFPNMLPSTFQEINKEKEKTRKKLKVKLEMAKFLQDTLEETALLRKGAKGEAAHNFVQFMNEIRSSGSQTSNEAIRKYSKLFEDDITLDSLSYGQLRALCKLLDLPTTVGTSNFLRFQLRMTLRKLEADDRMIQKEGMDSLAVWELQEACRSRGMRALGVPEERLKFQLSQWLDLHLNEKIPTSLLLLSRTLYLPEQLSSEAQLAATISTLPETATEEAKVKISEVTGERVDNKTKLEIIKQEEEAIRKEEEEEKVKAEEEAQQKEAEAKRLAEKKERRAAEMVAMAHEEVLTDPLDAVKDVAEPITPSIVDSAPDMKPRPEEVLVDKATVLEDEAVEPVPEKAMDQISKEDLEDIEDVLEKVSEEKKAPREKDDLEALKEDVSEYKEALEDLKEVVLSTGGSTEDLQETKAAKRLSSKVNTMIEQIETIMTDLHKEKEQLMEAIEVKEVKIKRSSELREDEERRLEVLEDIEGQKRNLISINELLLGLRRLQKVPDDTKIQRIAQVLDEDNDGIIDIHDAIKVIQLLGEENVKINADKMSEIITLMKREEQIEQEEKERKQKEKLEKQQKQAEEEAMATPPGEELKDSATDMSSETPSGGDAKTVEGKQKEQQKQ